MLQAGLNPALSSITAAPSSSSSTRENEADSGSITAKVGSKRKFVLDQEELERIAEDDRTKAKKSIEYEKVQILPQTIISLCWFFLLTFL